VKSSTYGENEAIDAKHWWYVVRRKLFARLIRELKLPSGAAVLDAGTSTGPNLGVLRDLGFSDIHGVDLSPEALRFCQSKGFTQVRLGDICALPYPDESFDLVLATDVIEHVDHDDRALREIRRVLRPGGTALLTVPAFQCLWGVTDDISEHRRRYLLGPLRERLNMADLSVDRTWYFNYLLFLPILIARRIVRLFPGKVRNENHLNFPLLNWVLIKVFAFDAWTAEHVRPPFGVSIMAICHKPHPKTLASPQGSSRAA
jgi:SAM-dependent methyltransferase